MKPLILFILFAWYCCLATEHANAQAAAYRVENINLPPGLRPVTGAMDFLPDGRLIACFLRGEVMCYDPATRKWTLFASGLQEPLGILVVSNDEVLVMQRPELTRIKDTDGDGEADLFETVTDDFGISGNYHEFNYGPVKDDKGNLFIGLNSASSNGSIRKEVRGRIDTATINQEGQMFSAVPYRGWIMKLSTDGNLSPYASGLRSPNGLGFDQQGQLFVTENQGDWVGTSALYHIEEGNFYGHPAGLVWRKNWQRGSPYLLPIAELDSMRTRASVLFPHGIIANSPTQPLWDRTGGKFGPFAGQLFVGEMNQERIVRVILETVDGALQGACLPFITGKGLRKGNNRLAFAPDGSLWVGQAVEQGWAGDEGIQRIVYTGNKPLDIAGMHLTKNGFELSFTGPIPAAVLASAVNYKFKRYYYEYHKKYGSDQFGVKDIAVKKVHVLPGGRKVVLELDDMKPGYIYELNLEPFKDAKGVRLSTTLICYTLNRLQPK